MSTEIENKIKVSDDLLKWALHICKKIQSTKTNGIRFPETASLGTAIEDYFVKYGKQ